MSELSFRALHLLWLLAVTIVSFSVASCHSKSGREIDSRLSSADMLMDGNPDSALAILTNIHAPAPGSHDSLTIRGDKRKALYALLLTQGRHKNYIDETDDSLITTAVNYFDLADNKPRLIKSLFYQAVINSNAKNFPSAMASSMRALKLAENLDDTYWQARISELIGHILSETYFNEEAVEYCKKAAYFFKQIEATKSYLYALSDVAIDYLNMNDHRHALIFTDSILKQNPDTFLNYFCSSIAVFSLFELGEYDKANILADSLIAASDSGLYALSSTDYSKIASVKLLHGNRKEARLLLDKAFYLAKSANDTISYYAELLNLYNYENDIRSANNVLADILSLQNKIARQIRQQSSVVAQRNFYSSEAAEANLIATKRQYTIIIGFSSSILIILMIVILSRYQIQRKNADIEHKVAQILLLTTETEQSRSKLSDLNSSVNLSNATIKELTTQLDNSLNRQEILTKLSHTLFQKHLCQLNLLINEFYEANDSKESRHAIYKNIEHEVKKLTNKKNLIEIEKIINSYLDNIINKMISQLSDFSSDDIAFLTLCIAGYSSRAIALFTNIKPNSTYTKKRRLINRIANSDAPDREWFIFQINNPLAD
ncbi:MAG: hypothetical protein K2J65_09205 [Duncaniella sp.]|nr:hypothetical protein [Duncaniella sp.]